MGLTLHYRLILPGHTSVDDVRSKLAALKVFASTVGFEAIHGPADYTADQLLDADDRDIVRIVVTTICGDPPDFYGVGSEDPCVLTFLVAPGQECESALFGFMAPGSRAWPSSPDDDLHPGDWFWSGSCKTQYASIVSDEHFVKCHVGLVRVLDHAVTLGIGVEVEDESGYWEHRSVEKLVNAVTDMNRLIARFAGALESRLGDGRIDAPIFDHPDFEHLEMQEFEYFDQADGFDPRTP